MNKYFSFFTGFMCDCEDTWQHEDADDVTTSCNVNVCGSIPGSSLGDAYCVNGGECLPNDEIDHDAGLYCNCTVGWVGPFCETGAS